MEEQKKMEKQNKEEKQILMLEAYSLKGLFVTISHDLDKRWEEARKIEDISERIDAFKDIFRTHDKVIDLMKATLKAIREARRTYEVL